MNAWNCPDLLQKPSFVQYKFGVCEVIFGAVNGCLFILLIYCNLCWRRFSFISSLESVFEHTCMCSRRGAVDWWVFSEHIFVNRFDNFNLCDLFLLWIVDFNVVLVYGCYSPCSHLVFECPSSQFGSQYKLSTSSEIVR